MSNSRHRRSAETRRRRRIEQAADRALATGSPVLVDGLWVLPDVLYRRLLAAYGPLPETVVGQRDGRLVYLFKAPKGWTP